MRLQGCFITIALLCRVILAEAELSALDPNVFKSLQRTSLRSLTGTYEDDGVVMKYVLTENMIEEVYAENGIFNVQAAQLLAQLPKTRGTLSGSFYARIILQGPSIFIPISGTYIARIADVDLSLAMNLTRTKDGKMNLTLDNCIASVSTLHLHITPRDEKDKTKVGNLNKWLTGAMLPSFSELFCDTMKKILTRGTDSIVFRALYSRICSIMRLPNCPPRR